MIYLRHSEDKKFLTAVGESRILPLGPIARVQVGVYSRAGLGDCLVEAGLLESDKFRSLYGCSNKRDSAPAIDKQNSMGWGKGWLSGLVCA
ncbi:hypothetical protein PGT21_028569 [Puccinia graminis f. sp. tritici]|uniref:Uncharacterized protein n=2 Tax=Puccinia graminis f. sp. tritici TaxID=56615 RepID=E3JSP0_PUCGT|nr:uncharacterized protein PGTG_01658 [Puccinia graminis f. sp. tritici CRL 75-36-700-3]EFP75065.2 hypothetical protein PGTG_01658 [Puccinia graminis f. sp. tritici CRL 75-36-700-3]KAA1117964.1 hypothetical protein PGT21_028569 [Puccinia graminis f. sp. tritici]